MNLLHMHVPDISVNITQEIADSNPKFVEFLVWLRHHYIDKDCSTLLLKKKLEDVFYYISQHLFSSNLYLYLGETLSF